MPALPDQSLLKFVHLRLRYFFPVDKNKKNKWHDDQYNYVTLTAPHLSVAETIWSFTSVARAWTLVWNEEGSKKCPFVAHILSLTPR